ncbi:hypothetical protein NQ318_012321 [Aromia moschata]|uniref:Uncharacterized protein n=1 Tax=Aromia moschata TaxID=1265417 RepID=A0AAV8YIW6_9CUCU|nr:hypothetical protein NQ318_012321 [Aromia moschata]
MAQTFLGSKLRVEIARGKSTERGFRGGGRGRGAPPGAVIGAAAVIRPVAVAEGLQRKPWEVGPGGGPVRDSYGGSRRDGGGGGRFGGRDFNRRSDSFRDNSFNGRGGGGSWRWTLQV